MTTIPQDTLKQLCEMLPQFLDTWADEQAPLEDGLIDGVYYEWTHHSVLATFLQYFASNRDGFGEQQIRRLCSWINEAVSVDGDLENAVSTCFLEHARQVKVNRILWPYLSPTARKKSHA